MRIAERLRLCAPPGRLLPTVSGSAHPAHVNCGTSQALCKPMAKFAGSLRLSAPRSCELRNVSGAVHPHDEITNAACHFVVFVHGPSEMCERLTPLRSFCLPAFTILRTTHAILVFACCLFSNCANVSRRFIKSRYLPFLTEPPQAGVRHSQHGDEGCRAS